jgi:hypothetical protein
LRRAVAGFAGTRAFRRSALATPTVVDVQRTVSAACGSACVRPNPRSEVRRVVRPVRLVPRPALVALRVSTGGGHRSARCHLRGRRRRPAVDHSSSSPLPRPCSCGYASTSSRCRILVLSDRDQPLRWTLRPFRQLTGAKARPVDDHIGCIFHPYREHPGLSLVWCGQRRPWSGSGDRSGVGSLASEDTGNRFSSIRSPAPPTRRDLGPTGSRSPGSCASPAAPPR